MLEMSGYPTYRALNQMVSYFPAIIVLRGRSLQFRHGGHRIAVCRYNRVTYLPFLQLPVRRGDQTKQMGKWPHTASGAKPASFSAMALKSSFGSMCSSVYAPPIFLRIPRISFHPRSATLQAAWRHLCLLRLAICFLSRFHRILYVVLR